MKEINAEYKEIKITELMVNPDNKRYPYTAEDEVSAIIAMLTLDSVSQDEMIALTIDIAENGLNKFEMPIVWKDEEQGTYIVVEGNRRISAIKLLTQYKENDDIKIACPKVYNKLSKIFYEGPDKILVVVYEDFDAANKVLPKIHQDVYGGIGRKQWGRYAKENYNREEGRKSKTNALLSFLEESTYTPPELLKKMKSERWVSKLERVVSFSSFAKYYKIEFDKEYNFTYKDSEEQFCKMLCKLVNDLIENTATEIIRVKKTFEEYYSNLPDEYKSQVRDCDEGHQMGFWEQSEDDKKKEPIEGDEGIKSPLEENTPEEDEAPKSKKKQSPASKALRFSKDYSDEELSVLNEKGKDIAQEMESLDIWVHPYAAASLCRELLEISIILWASELKISYNGKSLEQEFLAIINELQKKSLFTDSKHHNTLHRTGVKGKFIESLNFWMHGDTQQCIQVETLLNGWKGCRILVERYIDYKKEAGQ